MMNSTTVAVRRPNRLRQIALAAAAAGLAASAILAGRAIVDFRDYASDHLVEFSASYKGIPDLASLTHDSDLVIVGRVADNGTLHYATPTNDTPRNNPAPAAPQATGTKADALQQNSANAAPPVGNVVNTIKGTPFTTFDIKVERVLQGSAAPGSDIVVTQPGGHVTLNTIPGVSAADLHRTVEFEHDTLMQTGDEHVMFLQKASDGTYFVVGGPQGRLSVDKGGKVHPIDPSSPALKGRDGSLLEGLAAEVSRIK